MKGNIKRLSVFVIIAAIAMFGAVGTASAVFHYSLHGEYGAKAECTCLIAPLGFNPDLTPINNAGIVSIQNRKSIWTFEKDGTGSVSGDISTITLAFVGPNGPVPPSASTSSYSNDFTYTATADGNVTITPGPASLTYTSGPNNGLTYQAVAPPSKGTFTRDSNIFVDRVSLITIFLDASNLGTLSGPNLPPVSPNMSCTCISVLSKVP